MEVVFHIYCKKFCPVAGARDFECSFPTQNTMCLHTATGTKEIVGQENKRKKKSNISNTVGSHRL